MLLTTTPVIEGKRITHYYGIVAGEAVLGANVLKDLLRAFVILSADVQELMKKNCSMPVKSPWKSYRRMLTGWVPMQ